MTPPDCGHGITPELRHFAHLRTSTIRRKHTDHCPTSHEQRAITDPIRMKRRHRSQPHRIGERGGQAKDPVPSTAASDRGTRSYGVYRTRRRTPPRPPPPPHPPPYPSPASGSPAASATSPAPCPIKPQPPSQRSQDRRHRRPATTALHMQHTRTHNQSPRHHGID